MRKVLFLAAVAAAAVFALSATPVASAWDCYSSCSSNSVYIEQYADYSWSLFINVVVDVRCSGGGLPAGPWGHLLVGVTQLANQSSSGHDAIGSGESDVNCDGTWHRVIVSVVGQYNLGCAMAQADFTDPVSKQPISPPAQRIIQITS